ncbi:TPA: hypothetical protein N0F65_008090 [Lagenidium giganteum]|uniref:Cilia- and flagella-associated protein 69 ARM repeats domain-containing protein n=1 Tax=Lagenidium giganteum TaxID=4803 RepID=A0AAV2Z0U6_9STRA|nr:TPA: hypothetical protein N0F65_008090 [Lagenidium giganteum]
MSVSSGTSGEKRPGRRISEQRLSIDGSVMLEEPPQSSLEAFTKLFKAVSDPQTIELHQRHLALVKNVLYQNEHGWRLTELPMVNDFLVLLRAKIRAGHVQFGEYLLAAVNLCAQPFVRLKTNEDIANPELLRGLIPTLGELLSCERLDVQVAATEALRHFAMGTCLARAVSSTGKPRNSASNYHPVVDTADDLRLPPRVFSQNMMEESGVVEAIANVFHELFPDESGFDGDEQLQSQQTQTSEGSTSCSSEERLTAMVFPLVDLVYEISGHQRCAEALVVSGTLHNIVFILANVVNAQDELLPLCLLILWNVLELCEEKMKSLLRCSSRRELLVHFRLRNATFFLGNEYAIRTLMRTLELLLVHGYRKQDREMRNEVIMILLLLAKRRRSLDLFYSTGLTACLLTYATAAELPRAGASPADHGHAKPGTPATSGVDTGRHTIPSVVTSTGANITANFQHFATNCDEDLEFKQLLWYLISTICVDHHGNTSELMQFRFLDALLDYATGCSNRRNNNQPASTMYSPPQLAVLQIAALSVLNNVTPNVLEHFYEINGHTTLLTFLESFTSSATAANPDDVLAATWLLILQVTQPVALYQDEMGAFGSVEAAIANFALPPSRHTFATRRNAILACTNMCRLHEANKKRFFRAKGVQHVVRHLDYDLSHAVLEDNIIIGTLEAVRSCIIGHAPSELAFIHADGVQKLLDILEKCPKLLQNQVLSALAEICVNPAAIPSYAAWRSDRHSVSKATANHVLLRIYADEEARDIGASSPDNKGFERHEEPLVAASNMRNSAFRSISDCRSPFIVFNNEPTNTPVGALEDARQSDATTARPSSPAFARLKEALKAGQGFSFSSNPATSARTRSLMDVETHPLMNLKAKIHAVLANVSFAGDIDKLSPQDQLMLEIAKEYPTFQVGEMWQNVHVALHAEGVRPIYPDALYVRRHIEHAYNMSVCTKFAQKEILLRNETTLSDQEAALYHGIMRQNAQEEQAEAFHRANFCQNSTMKLHLDAKRTRLEFMKRQDPTAYALYEAEKRNRIDDPPPDYDEELCPIEQKEHELRGRLSTISLPRESMNK